MHPFGKEEAASLERLFGFFCECVRSGHWELAQACVPQLSRWCGDGGDVLRSASDDVLAAGGWWDVGRSVGFYAEVSRMCPGIWFIRTIDGCSQRFSLDVVSALRKLLLRAPQRAQVLLEFFQEEQGTHSPSIQQHCSLQNIFVEFLRDSLKSLQRLQCGSEISELDQRELTDIIYSVLSMVTFEVEHQADELQHLFRELLDVCWAEGSPLREEKLLSCMLRKRSRGLLNLYSSVLMDKTREKFLVSKSAGKGWFFFFLCCAFPLPPHTMLYFYFLSVNAFLVTLQLRRVDSFVCLSVQDLCNDSVLKDFCDGLWAQVEVLEWCIQQNSITVPRKVLLQHLHSLDCHTAIYSLHHLTNLLALNEEEVIELLQKVPARDQQLQGKWCLLSLGSVFFFLKPDSKGSLLGTLVEQASLKPVELEKHLVWNQTQLLLRTLDQHFQTLPESNMKTNFVKIFFDYITTLAAVVLRSLNTELVKVGNPFILLQQSPSQLLSQLLFERQVQPDRLSSLLAREELSLNVQQVIVNCCCERLSLCNSRQKIQAKCLLANISNLTHQCAKCCLPDVEIPFSNRAMASEDVYTQASPSVADLSQNTLTASCLDFLKSQSKLTATVACLSASNIQKIPKSSLSWMEFWDKRELPLGLEQISRECEALLKEFPILERFLLAMFEPLQTQQEEGGSLAGVFSGRTYIPLVLLGLHSSTAVKVLMEVFEQALAAKDWTRALKILDLYSQDVEELVDVKDAVLSCAAAEGKDGWQYLFPVKNATLRSVLALRCLDKWPLDACLEILVYCSSDLDISDELKANLQSRKKELQVYQKILNLQKEALWSDWQDLKKACTDDPQAIMNIILKAKDYELCEEWGRLYPVPREDLINLHREHLLHLLETGDMEKASQLLQRIEDPGICLAISEQSLDQHPSLAASHFLADYLTTHFYSNLTTARRNEIQALYMGSKVLLTLPELSRVNYFHLSSRPLLMVEQLLMNMKVDWVSVAVQTLHQLLGGQEVGFAVEDIDNLLSKYAEKALDFPFSLKERRSDSVIRIQESLCQVLECEAMSKSGSSELSLASFTGVAMSASPRERSLQQNFSEEFVPPEKPPPKQQWIPDDTETICMVCKTERFTMFNRRHHCRRCGRLVCSSCSTKKMEVEACRENPTRVCDQCYSYYNREHLPGLRELEWLLMLRDQVNRELLFKELSLTQSSFRILCVYVSSESICICLTCFSPSYISKVDVLNILVAAAYRPVPSLDQILLPAAVTRLRNRLLEAEYYQLAIEVSTKSGLDPSGAWHAWGMACLKAGNLSSAREKFNRCLKPPVDLNQLNHGSRLVQDVIQYLESTVKPVLIQDDDYFATLRELEATLRTRSLSLEMMSEGKVQHNSYYQECLFYLHSYGTNLAIISFYMRHDCMREALLHLLNKESPSEVFIEGIFIPSYESGKLHMLENLLETIDPGLESWGMYLIAACKFLQKKNYYHILYELQQFMKDHVRAAMTCIRFFTHGAKSYTELGGKQTWLIKIKDHLKVYLQEVSRSSGRKKMVYTFRKKMSATDVSRHINTVDLQMEVTKFLHRCEISGSSQMAGSSLPTLFGNNNMKMDVACKVMLEGKNVEEGFGIAFRVLQDFQLEATEVYSKVAKQLVKQQKYSEIRQLLKCVSESGVAAKNDGDTIILNCLSEFKNIPAEDLDNLIQDMDSDENKIQAYLMCNKLRSAYLVSVRQEKSRAVQLVQHVRQLAESSGEDVVHAICTQWLTVHQPKMRNRLGQGSRK
uniref:Zinc finger FYVE domain-containing protein 26 n=1 Tax=Pavo cristatus TaxID=9049 RepID=A0A8C9EIQ0_PAVCR